jgi:hypothetical protein
MYVKSAKFGGKATDDRWTSGLIETRPNTDRLTDRARRYCYISTVKKRERESEEELKIEQTTTYKTIALLRSGTSASAKQMAALPWIRSETTTLMTLRRTLDLAELLTIQRTLAPTSFGTRFVTWRTCFGGDGEQ